MGKKSAKSFEDKWNIYLISLLLPNVLTLTRAVATHS